MVQLALNAKPPLSFRSRSHRRGICFFAGGEAADSSRGKSRFGM